MMHSASKITGILRRYLAIDQGPEVVMIENYRTGFIWDLFMSSRKSEPDLKNSDSVSEPVTFPGEQ